MVSNIGLVVLFYASILEGVEYSRVLPFFLFAYCSNFFNAFLIKHWYSFLILSLGRDLAGADVFAQSTQGRHTGLPLHGLPLSQRERGRGEGFT
jgi:hypothetical protein